MLGPMHHYYYIKLDQLIPKVNLKTVFIKIAADQFVCAPLTILFFFYGMGVLESKNLEEISNEIKLKFKYVYMVSISTKVNTLNIIKHTILL